MKPRKPLHGEIWLTKNGNRLLMLDDPTHDLEIKKQAVKNGADSYDPVSPKWNFVGRYDEHGKMNDDEYSGAYDCVELVGSAIATPSYSYLVVW